MQVFEFWSLLCNFVSNFSDFSLRFEKGEMLSKENIHQISNGTKLKLTLSPQKSISFILENLETHGNQGVDILLHHLSSNDKDFLNILLNDYSGMQIILKRLEYDLETHEDSKMINYLLEALCLIVNQTLEDITEPIKDKLVLDLSKSLAGKDWDAARLKHACIFLTVIQKSARLTQIVKDTCNIASLSSLVLNADLGLSCRMSCFAMINEKNLN